VKIIDAFWEKRNLGVTCKEIVIEDKDDISCLNEIKKLDADTEYVVAKVPVSKPEISLELQKEKFCVIETSFEVNCDVDNIKLNPYYQRFYKQMSYEIASADDISKLNDEIKNGIFDTDRVFLDPYFNKEQAANRYINWINDELNKGSELYIIKYKNNKIGFFTFKQISESTYYPFLAGLFNEYKDSGLGFSIVYCPVVEVKRRAGKKIKTSISSNNQAVAKIHFMLGYMVDRMYYILTKHR
jgi:hypothetical protein